MPSSLHKLEQGQQDFHKRSKEERATISAGMCFETFQYTLEEPLKNCPST
ncbi:hypothetical protein [Flavihumibacter sp. CACIAM 22H1]|nr:hypothetical protein [Flavihumibacter sp. CACIAM 22H1]